MIWREIQIYVASAGLTNQKEYEVSKNMKQSLAEEHIIAQHRF